MPVLAAAAEVVNSFSILYRIVRGESRFWVSSAGCLSSFSILYRIVRGESKNAAQAALDAAKFQYPLSDREG